ncbi:nitrilase-related carbon-nitrogen hydrolase [Fulvimonas sp. R45]|uniref:nitrilase-related carbon-nitrogen hydrolase n=1 Tax=Fulvimonas sp. R45 TaxID=3045937 RepID=UPI00265D6389|nr:nitrilase-related carbon-nitrogen hydrolase [Fulvimonas sp. R45]MDO1528582.1 nitrilase-related carbon-nitrogen hydrolase [Fulvimonas sp. R45]
MASRLDRRRLAAGLAATALSALCWWFGSGLHPLWWLTWLAPLPVLWMAPRTRARWAAPAAFAAYAIGGFNQWSYLHGDIGLPMSTIVPAIGGPALVLALAVLLYRRLLAHGRVLAATLAPAMLWVAAEYANSLLSPHGTFGCIAYYQMGAPVAIQVAAVTGLWGIGFLLLLLPTALAMLATPRQPAWRGRTPALALVALLVAASLAYGVLRLRAPATASLRIGLVSLEKPIRPALDEAAGQALEARYLAAIDRLADAGAKVIVIPETSFATDATTVPAFARLAQQRGLTIDAGIDARADPHTERNMAMVFEPGAVSPATYSKHHLIPGFERQYTPGRGYRMLDGAPRIGLAICKDMDFHDIGQAYAARDAQLLLVPAWDFHTDGWLHSRMAIMRGVESGFAIARVARSGRLTLSDDRGRVVAEASSEKHDAERVGDLPLRTTHTLYARWGDWFAWLDLAGLPALLVLAWRPARADR